MFTDEQKQEVMAAKGISPEAAREMPGWFENQCKGYFEQVRKAAEREEQRQKDAAFWQEHLSECTEKAETMVGKECEFHGHFSDHYGYTPYAPGKVLAMRHISIEGNGINAEFDIEVQWKGSSFIGSGYLHFRRSHFGIEQDSNFDIE